ncbi:hypothetical protein Tco_1111809 [Tanacetum coccineum]|uniref:Uncharacterized protein n=1 Tax=Tanacetum coccineum TaxID=301880 RepID=A0ABQ5IN57_9ASTR
MMSISCGRRLIFGNAKSRPLWLLLLPEANMLLLQAVVASFVASKSKLPIVQSSTVWAKDCTAIETLKEKYRQEKTEGNAEFHEIIDFLTRSSIHHALTVSPVVSTTFVEQNMDFAKYRLTTNQAILSSTIQLMGGKHFSGNHYDVGVLGGWCPLFASMLVQPTEDEGAPSERPSEAQPTPSPAHTSEVPIEPQTDSSLAHTSEVPIEPQTDPSPRPSPSTIIPDSIPESSGGNLGGHSSSDKSLSGNEGEMTLQSVYDLCLSLCAQVSDQAKEIQHLKAQIKKLKKQAKPGRKFAKGEPSVQRDPLFEKIPEDTHDYIESENAQDVGRTRDIMGEEKEYVEDVLSTEDILSTNKEKVSTDKEKVSTDRPIVSTDGSKVSTDRQKDSIVEQIEGTDEQRKGIDDHTKEGSVTQNTQPPPTSTIFGDDETITKVLLNMSHAKAVSREKEKCVELKDIEETDRPKPTSTRSLLTLNPLPTIDPKDKGKKKIEEEDETESESDGIPKGEKKFKQLASDEEMARKIQEWEGEEERNRLAEEKATNEALIRNYDDIKARIEADRLLAKKLQEEEREQFTIEERAKFLHDTIAAQRKFLAQQRSEAIRNRPPTKNQLRNQMMTYLKHVGNFKQIQNLKTEEDLGNT